MEEKKKKRGWIKDAAIIFLVLLLVLTFFSNTIMNRSLPEVTTAYVTGGTITTKIRGTGTVTARENYDVTIEQTRKVKSVAVRSGDQVHAGDVLFTLEPGDSSELSVAKETLANLEKQYQLTLLNASSADYARENRQIQKSREALEKAQAELQALEASGEEGGEYALKLAAAQVKVDELEAEYLKAQTEWAPLLDAEKLNALKQAVKTAEAAVKEKKAALKAAQASDSSAQLLVNELTAAYEEKAAVYEEKSQIYSEKNEILAECNAVLNEYASGSADYSAVNSASSALSEAQQALADAKTAKETALVLYGDDYSDLVEEAKSMIRAKWDADTAAAAKASYLASHSLAADAVLTPEQQTELDSAISTAQAANPVTEQYLNNHLNVYIPAAAQKNAGSHMARAYTELQAADAAISAAESSVSDAENRYSEAYSAYWEKNQQNTARSKAQKNVDAAKTAVDAAKKEMDAAKKDMDSASAAVKAAEKELAAQIEAAETALTDANTAVSEAQEALNEEETIQSEAQGTLDSWSSKLEAAKQEVKTLEAGRKSDLEQAKLTVENCAESLEDLVFNLEQQKASDEKTAKREALDRQEQLDAIEKQKALIEELSKEESGDDVVAKVSGIIKSITVSAGYKAMGGDVLATIEVPDLGYTLSFSVTNEQARRLHVGDTSTVSNYYWGSKIEAELISIVTDPQNPQSSKRLTFSLTGDVTAGNSLTLSVGDKNANYDMVVPNSALKSDSKGSFILIITAKNSPLGNRYYASRVDVEVISADDQYSAISGPLEGYESVIISTGGNAPIASGDQVRLADNNA